jgi:two-component system sensor histidine kinase UhpB
VIGDRVSLRLQINLLIAGLIAIFVAVVFAFDVVSTRSSVREEIQASNIVAAQLMANFVLGDGEQDRLALVNYLSRLGRVRATDISLHDATGGVVYRSPPSTYKAGRDAPAWYSALVAPAPIRQEFHLPFGDLVIEANASRAVLDGWDDAVRLFEFGIVIVVVGNLFVFWLVGRTTRPFRLIAGGLKNMQTGAYDTRLPDFVTSEASAIARAFNQMAQSIQDNLGARREALEANINLEQSRELALTIQNRVEEERRQIARELHDETGQSVTAIRSLALALVQRLGDGDAQARDNAQLIADTAAHLYTAMHDLIPRLRPVALDNLGLVDALEEQVNEWRRQHPDVEFTLTRGPLPDNLGESYALAAFRIVQEAATNALRHARPARIQIDARADAHTLALEIRDDGAGLPPDWQKPGHFGIRGMRERARMLGGEVRVENLQGRGVRVAATLPLN